MEQSLIVAEIYRWNRFWRLPCLQRRRNDICPPKGWFQVPHDCAYINGHCRSSREECWHSERTSLSSRGRTGRVHDHETTLRHWKVIWRRWAGPELQNSEGKEKQRCLRFLELQLRHNRIAQSRHDLPPECHCAGLAGTKNHAPRSAKDTGSTSCLPQLAIIPSSVILLPLIYGSSYWTSPRSTSSRHY